MSQVCHIKVGRDKDQIVFKIEGYASFLEAAEITRYIESVAQKDPYKGFIFDLNDCEKMDSTFMGLIARLAFETEDESSVRVVASQGKALKCLEDLGLTQIVKITQKIDLTGIGFSLLEASGLKRIDKEDTIRKSHETLSSINDENRKKFQDVIKSLKSDN